MHFVSLFCKENMSKRVFFNLNDYICEQKNDIIV